VNAQERAARGIRAKALMNDETVQAAFAEIEAEIIAEWRRTPWFWRQRMKWAELRGLERVRATLASYARHAPK